MSAEHSQVVVGFDFTHSACAAMYRAIAVANRAPFHILHFVCAIVHVRIGHAAEEILDLARGVGADLIIVGSKGLVGVERFVLGSVAERVAREAGCTVEVARPKTYEHVELLDVTSAEHHRRYTPPHRYTYRSSCVNLRPDEWPLY